MSRPIVMDTSGGFSPKSVFGAIGGFAGSVVSGTVDTIKDPIGSTTKAFDATVDGAKAVGSATVDTIKDPMKVVDATVDGAKAVGSATVDVSKAVGSATVDGAKNVASGTVDTIKDPMKVVDATVDGAKMVGSATVDGAKAVGTATVDGAKVVGTAAVDGASAVADLGAAAIESTFSLLGVTAAFQSVFGGDLDKSDEGLAKAFANVDADGSGKISSDEMKAYIVKIYGKSLDAKMVDEMMKAADTDGDGEVDLDEFKKIMRAGPEKK